MRSRQLTESQILDLIREILWPGGDADHEWSSDEVAEIAELLEQNGLGPRETR